jgi:cytoskeleton protein RodZ
VSDLPDNSMPAADEPYARPSAGAELRAAREASGLSIDEVAQQLKLAPRQVQALEHDDYASLPGRTFVRGFVRNYARFMQLDVDGVLGLLPDSDVAPALERPAIIASGRPMGELPADVPSGRSWTRWVIPLVLAAIVVIAGVYEFRRQQNEAQRASVESGAAGPGVTTPATPGSGTSSAVLPNPLSPDAAAPSAPGVVAPGGPAGSSPAAPTDADTTPPASSPSSSAPATSSTASAPMSAPSAAVPSGAIPAQSSSATVQSASTAAQSASTTAQSTSAAASPASGTAAGSSDTPQLVVTFKGRSWIQVRDRNGNTLIAENAQGGSTQSVSGPLPLDVVIGNARQVSATFRGQPVDLSPYVRGDVARLSLK